MEFVPHKPPKPIKRTSSVKLNNRLKANLEKSGLSSSISSQYKAKLDGLQNKNFISNKKPLEDNNSNKIDDPGDANEKTFDVFVKEKDVNENKSEIQMDSLEVYAMQRMERMKQVSMDSLDVIEDTNDFAKDSLDYYAEQNNKLSYGKFVKDQNNQMTSRNDASVSNRNRGTKENIDPKTITDEIKKYKYIERKIEIINKLVEMEERKILQEKILKEYRMKPLKANINDGTGVVKVLSRKFENLATKQTVPNFASLTLEEADTDTENNSDGKEIKRNLSLPDILDSEQIGGLVTEAIETSCDAGNELAESDVKLNNTVETAAPKILKQRVYNEMVIPKTDVHLDSENYESSTTSSSCTNSPKRLSLYFSRPKPPFRKIIRVPTPRLCMENKMALCTSSHRFRPVLHGSGVRAALAKRVPFHSPILPSHFVPQGWERMFLQIVPGWHDLQLVYPKTLVSLESLSLVQL